MILQHHEEMHVAIEKSLTQFRWETQVIEKEKKDKQKTLFIH